MRKLTIFFYWAFFAFLSCEVIDWYLSYQIIDYSALIGLVFLLVFLFLEKPFKKVKKDLER